MTITQSLAERLAEAMPEDMRVEIGMRYGKPSIRSGLEKLREAGVTELVTVPLYPQFSHTTTSSIYDAVDASLEAMGWQPGQKRVMDYHLDEEWTCAIAQSIYAYREQNGQIAFVEL